MLYVEAAIPPGIAPGPRPVRLLTDAETASPAILVTIVAPLPTVPTIISFRNLVDFGTDIEVTGPKSAITICVVGLDQTASPDNVRLRVRGRELRPDYVGFDPNFAGYKVDLKLPVVGPEAVGPRQKAPWGRKTPVLLRLGRPALNWSSRASLRLRCRSICSGNPQTALNTNNWDPGGDLAARLNKP